MAGSMNSEEAQAIAIDALGFIGADQDLMNRFLAITGIEADGIRQAAAEPGFLAGVLRFILAHEPTLLAFAAASEHDPARIAAALPHLPGGDDGYAAST